MPILKNCIQTNRHKTISLVLCLLLLAAPSSVVAALPTFALFATKDSTATTHTPTAQEKVYLLFAETLEFDQEKSADYQVLRGNVQFRKDSMFMYCDSAYFYELNNSLDAFGNVRMEQGDTLFVYSDYMSYNGNTAKARLRENVRMINKEVTLYTDSLNYDQTENIGYYFTGGKIVDSQNTLTSIYGQYSPNTKQATFNRDVELVNEQYTIYSDTLEYGTDTKIADILGKSVIVSDSNTIYTNKGWYNTALNTAMLLDSSQVVGKEQTLTGDTIYYNRNTGEGEVYGNMILNDTVKQIIMNGQFGYYNEQTEYAFVTDRATMIEYSSSTDTLFLHADTLRSFSTPTTRLLQAFHGVRFFRNQSQGVCDSLEYAVNDSTLSMFQQPILWNNDQQILGDTIKIFMNDSTIEWAHIPKFAFVAQRKDSLYFDQLTGKDIKAYFENGDIRQIDVNGNVQSIFFPQEENLTYTGLNKAESSYLSMFLKNRVMEKLIMSPAVQGALTPIPMVKKSMLFLPDFKWHDKIRPRNKMDIYRKTEQPEVPSQKGRKSKGE